jgi:hypothetical protein
MINAPGIYEIEAAKYHKDPMPVPSLSCSIARMLIRQTPMHAWQAHARFGAVGVVPNAAMDDGSAVHAMFAGQDHLIEPVRAVYGVKTKDKSKIGLPVRDYKTADAQDERDEIRAMGRIPVLQYRHKELKYCYEAIRIQLEKAEDGAVFLSQGRSEVMAVAREGETWLRALVDRLPDDPKLPPGDLKLTELSAAPGGWERRLQTEYAFQAAFYARVLKGAEGHERPPMRFGVGELEPPHGAVIMAAAPSLMMLAEAEVERAIRIWERCMSSGEWPGYPTHTAWVDAKPWQVQEAQEAMMREEMP